ncbi:MAG: hypothetical protein FJZ01_11055 [Candidatus Sericytochromatia bacterium]|nr:hypothetical protein [Candidatus Tanganyikabacteria bacterium]
MRLLISPVLVALTALPALAAPEVFKASEPIRKLRAVRLDGNIAAVKRFDLYPDAPPGKLFALEVEHDPEVKPRVELAGGTLSLTSERPKLLQGSPDQEWDVHLSPLPVWDLALKFGAARAIMDLGGLKVRDLSLSTGAATVEVFWEKLNRVSLEHAEIEGGASRVKLRGLGFARIQNLAYQGGAGTLELDFAGPLSGTAQVDIQAGVGAIDLKVPKAIGIRVVEKDVALAHVSWPDDLDGRETPNYAKAKGRINLKLTAAVGRVRVSRI